VAQRRKSARDLTLSLLVLAIPIVALVWIQQSNSPDKPDVHSVNWHSTADKARRQAPFAVLAPSSLPKGWRATRVDWTRRGHRKSNGDHAVRNQWRLGLLTDHNIYIELDQGDKHPAGMIKKATRHGRPDGTVTIDGSGWRRLVTNDNRTRALVHPGSKVTTVVTGDTSYAKLRSFTELLRK
jgi:hypothetical protein